MVDAPWTVVRDTPNKSVRQNVPRAGAVLHHAAMTSLSGLRSLAMGAKQVSADGICKDDEIELLLDGQVFRAWSLSSALWDSKLHSVETCNESTSGWTVSDASHHTLARAVAFWAAGEGWWPHRDGDPRTWTVIGHREVYTIHGASYATACPGGMNLDYVVELAQKILNGGQTPTKAEDEDMAKGTVVGTVGNAETDGLWMIDDAQRTKWNIIAGYTGPDAVEEAYRRLDWYRARGFEVIENQPSWVLAGYRDITHA